LRVTTITEEQPGILVKAGNESAASSQGAVVDLLAQWLRSAVDRDDEESPILGSSRAVELAGDDVEEPVAVAAV
jgi:hypothetical protein